MARLSLTTFVLIYLFCVVTATDSKSRLTSLFAPQNGKLPRARCINLGAQCEAAGHFLAEADLIKYRNPQPGLFSIPSLKVKGARFNRAFVTQRMNQIISFVLKVDKRFIYNVTLGFAELDRGSCKPGARVMNLNVQGASRFGVDVFKAAGCQKPYHATFEEIQPGRLGFLSGFVRGINSTAQIATICVERVKRVAVPMASASSARRVLKPSKCQQKDCFSYDGHGEYVVIGNSMSEGEDKRNCRHRKTSSARLTIPANAKVKKAILYWSASGQLTEREAISVNGSLVATASFNGISLAANKTQFGGYKDVFRFYGAWADVTDMVRGNGVYEVGGVWLDESSWYCEFNSAYAAWSLAVIYELRSLPPARLNLCLNEFTFTYPANSYRSKVACIDGKGSTTKARTTVVSFESDAYKGEYFYINGVYRGDNIFRGQTAPNVDIVSFDVLNVVRSGVKYLLYTIESYVTQTVFGIATEGLFMAMHLVYHTLD